MYSSWQVANYLVGLVSAALTTSAMSMQRSTDELKSLNNQIFFFRL